MVVLELQWLKIWTQYDFYHTHTTAKNVFHVFNWHSWMLGFFQSYRCLRSCLPCCICGIKERCCGCPNVVRLILALIVGYMLLNMCLFLFVPPTDIRLLEAWQCVDVCAPVVYWVFCGLFYLFYIPCTLKCTLFVVKPCSCHLFNWVGVSLCCWSHMQVFH